MSNLPNPIEYSHYQADENREDRRILYTRQDVAEQPRWIRHLLLDPDFVSLTYVAGLAKVAYKALWSDTDDGALCDPLEPGDAVLVYEDPVTCLHCEGTAVLVEQIRPDTGDGLSLWRVRFGGETETVTRTINNQTA